MRSSDFLRGYSQNPVSYFHVSDSSDFLRGDTNFLISWLDPASNSASI